MILYCRDFKLFVYIMFKAKGLGHIPDAYYTKWPAANGAKAYVPYVITPSVYCKDFIFLIAKKKILVIYF